jgi:hypothetical protein
VEGPLCEGGGGGGEGPVEGRCIQPEAGVVGGGKGGNTCEVALQGCDVVNIGGQAYQAYVEVLVGVLACWPGLESPAGCWWW